MVSSTDTTTDFGLLEISGPDSERFLQGQLTCNVTTLSSEQWQFGACCNAKGRMVANFIIARDADRFILRLPPGMVDILQQHLSKYAVFFKTTVQSLDWARSVGVEAEAAAEAASDTSHSQLQSDSWTLFLSDGRSESWSAAQTAPLSIEDAHRWQLADIHAGIGWVTPASSEAWVPQYIGWDKVDGISFNKGCYTGQEVVARLQYLGKSKRQLIRFEANGLENTAIMAAITQADSGKECGELVSLSGTQGLAVAQGIGAQGSTADGTLLLAGIPLSRVEPVFEEAKEH